MGCGKKLQGLAKLMFGAPDTSHEDATVLGIEISQRAPFVLWARHEKLYHLMRVSSRQWRLGAMGGVLGLDIAAVKIIADGLGIEWSKELVEQIGQFEAAACTIMMEATS